MSTQPHDGWRLVPVGPTRDDQSWLDLVRVYFDNVDSLPHHYHMHLMHGAQIAGHWHPVELFRNRWLGFYMRACHDLHLHPETLDEMNHRLGDWNRKHWDQEAAQ